MGVTPGENLDWVQGFKIRVLGLMFGVSGSDFADPGFGSRMPGALDRAFRIRIVSFSPH